MDVVLCERPDLVVLAGPFVDGWHQMVNEGIPTTLEAIFKARVLWRVMDASVKLAAAVKFMLVHYIYDIHNDFVALKPAF